MKKLLILGSSDAGVASLSPSNKEALGAATLLVGGERHLESANGVKAEKLALKGNYKEAAERIRVELEKGGSPVVLASGDPLFYGIARLMISKLGADKVEVRPHLSSMQLAFARAGVSWEDAPLLSVHGRPLENLAPARTAAKIGVFTDSENNPSACAAFLLAQGWPAESRTWVCENLEGKDEKVTALALKDVEGKKFGDLNVLVVAREAAPELREASAFGLPDEAFAQRKPEKGLITKSEVRVLSLSKMKIFPGACVWDIGAATGSVSIEAARLGALKVWAIEKNEEDCENARENVRRFGVPQVKVLLGKAPEALSQVPENGDPDSVFVGGSSGKMSDILAACLKRLRPKGVIVVNTVTLENQAEAMEWFKASGMSWDCLQVQVSRRKPILDLQRLEALNPVMIFWGSKP